MSHPNGLPVVEADESLWTVEELAAWLRLSPRTVLARLRKEQWPHRDTGKAYLFTAADRGEIISRLAVNTDRASPIKR